MSFEWVLRARDVLVAGVALLLLSPLLLLLSIAIRLDSAGPVLFRQERVGRGGGVFRIRKFRSMSTSPGGPSVSTSTDARITRVGRVIRTAKLDELPQLLDVFQGRMSLVGPRPEVPRFVEQWPSDLRPLILSVRPGITDPATVILRNEAEYLAQFDDPEKAYVEKLLPAKAAIYAAYVRNRTFMGDARVIAQTVLAIVRPGAHAAADMDERVIRAKNAHP